MSKNLKRLIITQKFNQYKRIALMTGMIALVLFTLAARVCVLAQPEKIAFQADQEDQCVIFLQTSNQMFYELKSYDRGVCEYTRGEVK